MRKPARFRRIWAIVSVLALGGLIAAAVTLADVTVADGDGVTPIANNDVALGTIPCGVETSRSVPIAISRNGSAGSTNVFKNSSTASVSVLSVSGTGVTAGVPAAPDNEISIPSNWSTQSNGTLTTDTVTGTVKVTPASSGPAEGSVTWRATGVNSSNSTIDRDDPMKVTWTAGSCDTTAPTSSASAKNADNSPYAFGDWTKQNVTVTLSAQDNSGGSGVKQIRYTTDGSDPTAPGGTVYVSPFTISSEGTTTVRWLAVDNAGNAETAQSGTIKIDKTKPSVSCGSADGSWHASDVSIACTASDGGSGLADANDASFNLVTNVATGTETSNASTGSRTVADKVDNSDTAGPIGGNMVDKKAPSIAGAATPGANADGWNNGDVSVSFQCDDGGSGVDTCGPDATLSDEGRNQSVTGQAADNVGNTASDSVSGINIDKGKPSAPTATPDKAKAFTDGAGIDWYKDSVIISYGGSSDPDLNDPRGVSNKSGSGVKGYSPNDSQVGSGTLNYSGKATDRADNSSDATTGTVKVDADAPTLDLTGCPTGTVVLGSTQSLTVAASDGESGLAANPPSPVSLDTSTVGSKTKTVEVEDKVGHKTSKSCTYSVVYDFSGFYQPVDMGGVFNKAKAGSAIPVKFSLDGAPQANSNSPGDGGAGSAVMTSARSVKLTCPSAATVDILEETVAASTSGLKYDPVADQWVYVWKTATTLANTCQRLDVTLADGTTKTANFQFTK